VTRLLAVALAAAGLFVAPVRADDDIDAKTKDILKKVGALYKDAKSMHADLAIEGTMESDGQDKRDIKVKGTIDMKRPNMLAIHSTVNKDDKMGVDVVCDGKSIFIHGRRLKQYTEKKAPEKLSEIGRVIFPLGQQNTGMLFQNVLAEDPTEQLLEGVTEGKHAGMEKVGGKEAHHLTFKQPNLDWEIWVAAEGEPFVLKAKNVLEGGNGKLSTIETYSNWKLNPELDKDAFKFKAPEEAKKVDRLGGQRDG
jgi:hypothetical protein